MAAPNDGEAHQSLGPEQSESTIANDGQSTRASVGAPTPSMPAPDVVTMSTRQVKEEETVLVTGPGTQLWTYSPEFARLMKSWSRLLNQASIFDV